MYEYNVYDTTDGPGQATGGCPSSLSELEKAGFAEYRLADIVEFVMLLDGRAICECRPGHAAAVAAGPA